MKYNAVTVTQLNKYLKDRFDEDENLNAILVKGEISNFKNHYTGHLYFTLKDENSLIKCIMFKSYAEKLTFKPKDGMKVMVFGTVSVFERDGVYQIYAKSMMDRSFNISNRSCYKRYNKCFNKKKSKCIYKTITSASTRSWCCRTNS